jgi:hypothetical protein
VKRFLALSCPRLPLGSLCENLRFRVFAKGDSMTYIVEKAEKWSFHTDSKRTTRMDANP